MRPQREPLRLTEAWPAPAQRPSAQGRFPVAPAAWQQVGHVCPLGMPCPFHTKMAPLGGQHLRTPGCTPTSHQEGSSPGPLQALWTHSLWTTEASRPPPPHRPARSPVPAAPGQRFCTVSSAVSHLSSAIVRRGPPWGSQLSQGAAVPGFLHPQQTPTLSTGFLLVSGLGSARPGNHSRQRVAPERSWDRSQHSTHSRSCPGTPSGRAWSSRAGGFLEEVPRFGQEGGAVGPRPGISQADTQRAPGCWTCFT